MENGTYGGAMLSVQVGFNNLLFGFGCGCGIGAHITGGGTYVTRASAAGGEYLGMACI